jgi:cytochrome c-type biogenesis protein CcmE
LRKYKYIVGIAIIVVCIVFLALISLRKTSVYYYTVSELLEKKDSLSNKPFRVNGNVVKGTISNDKDNRILTFEITDGRKTLKVLHKGMKPDLLVDEKEVVLEGSLGKDGIFYAEKIITKCPSKYEPK